MTALAIKLGANCWGQYSDWPSLRAAGIRADSLGYDSLWTWDHLYPIVGSHEGPIFEGWLTLAAWAEATERATIGLMVGANTFRNPALVAKLATTLDHISGGRAVLVFFL
ncbi:MAG: LLM class flavin-dependent oxidoreductase [Chloroflexi bacterium]|nr:LLM class flavin-dependent oxidoreductase [Chloroflexota bacterium]